MFALLLVEAKSGRKRTRPAAQSQLDALTQDAFTLSDSVAIAEVNSKRVNGFSAFWRTFDMQSHLQRKTSEVPADYPSAFEL